MEATGKGVPTEEITPREEIGDGDGVSAAYVAAELDAAEYAGAAEGVAS
jgi:hypothetical protein